MDCSAAEGIFEHEGLGSAHTTSNSFEVVLNPPWKSSLQV
jgi:hypothetical protein